MQNTFCDNLACVINYEVLISNAFDCAFIAPNQQPAASKLFTDMNVFVKTIYYFFLLIIDALNANTIKCNFDF